MTRELDRGLQAVAFDDDADRPRSGWKGGRHVGLVELWVREAAGLKGVVVGGLGSWSFAVSLDETVIAEGTSSRRGWAMDGADDNIPTVN